MWVAGCEAIEEVSTGPGYVTLRASFVDDPSPFGLGGVLATITDDSWMDQWRAHAQPYDVGRLTVWPSWIPSPPTSSATVLLIDPRRAFGFDHPTTRLVLADVDRLVVPGDSVLDVGCGSGILGIGALLLGAQTAIGIDIEADAMIATHENAFLNQVGDRFAASLEWSATAATYNLVLANLLAPILRELAPPITESLAPNSILVASGLLVGQWETVAEWYPSLCVHDRHQLESWESITLALR